MLRSFALASVVLFFVAAAPVARAQGGGSSDAGAGSDASAGSDAGAPTTAPAESACATSTLGSDCNSSTTTAGGTCIAGCCCHYLAVPAGELSCASCLACSDTANDDPAFTPGACSDGGGTGTTPVVDASVPFVVDSGSGAPATSTAPSSGCSCTSAGVKSDAPFAVLALGAVFFGLAGTRRRERR